MQTDTQNSANQKNNKATPALSKSLNQIKLAQIFIGLLIGIFLAFSIEWIPGHITNYASLRTVLKLRPLFSSHFDSEDHARWLSWHKVQLKNPIISNQEPNEHITDEIDPTSNQPTHQPPSLKEEIKKIINSNKLKLDNFNIIHSSDEL